MSVRGDDADKTARSGDQWRRFDAPCQSGCAPGHPARRCASFVALSAVRQVSHYGLTRLRERRGHVGQAAVPPREADATSMDRKDIVMNRVGFSCRLGGRVV